MATHLNLAAIDLGASSGKVFLGGFDGSRLHVREVRHFLNLPVKAEKTLYWDILRLFHEVKSSLVAASDNRTIRIDGIGIDSWGNDFGLLDKNGRIISNPVHYRDDRTLGMMEKVFETVPKEYVYRQTGIQIMRLNGLYQLFSMFYNREPVINIAQTLLLIPDLLVYFLTGLKTSEFTNASTTQMLNPHTMNWAEDFLGKLGISPSIFTAIVQPCTILGKLSNEIVGETGLRDTKMIAVAEHDTGSAVVSIPALGDDFVYVSSGTWSLMGVEVNKPIINEKTYKYNFTNEGGAFGTFRLLKNIMGLWIVQQCRQYWEGIGEKITFAQLEADAWGSEPFARFIDPDDDLFLSPGDMPHNIDAFCLRTGQTLPRTKGAYVRCVMESLALKHRLMYERIEDITGKTYDNIYIVGGGVRDAMFCGFIACATGKRVLAGCEDASAVGNIAVQAVALNEISGLQEVRRVIRDSFPVKEYQPESWSAWNDAYSLFLSILHSLEKSE